jgi:hypothetical protein
MRSSIIARYAENRSKDSVCICRLLATPLLLIRHSARRRSAGLICSARTTAGSAVRNSAPRVLFRMRKRTPPSVSYCVLGCWGALGCWSRSGIRPRRPATYYVWGWKLRASLQFSVVGRGRKWPLSGSLRPSNYPVSARPGLRKTSATKLSK